LKKNFTLGRAFTGINISLAFRSVSWAMLINVVVMPIITGRMFSIDVGFPAQTKPEKFPVFSVPVFPVQPEDMGGCVFSVPVENIQF